MPVIIEAHYAKKIGLPGYSSHQFAVTLRTELTELGQLERTVTDLYGRLQTAVDAELVKPGVMPTSGETTPPVAPPEPRPEPKTEQPWKCSDKQRELILKIVHEHGLDKEQVDALAQQRFGARVRELNKLQASSLIDELLETHSPEPRRSFRRPFVGRSR